MMAGAICMREVNDAATTISEKTAFTWPIMIGVASVLLWGGWVTSELNTIKSTMLRSAVIEPEVRNLSARMEMLEKRGSEPLQALQHSVDKMAEELRVHQVMTEKLMKGDKP